MNTSRFFWGTLWIVTGVLILLAKLDVMTLQVGSLWKFWPLVLVLWGIGLFTGARAIRSLIAVIGAILLVLIIYGVWEEWGSGRDNREQTTQTFMETYDSTLHLASLRFVSGAGSFTLRDTCAALFRAETMTDFGKYEMDSRTGSEGKDLTLRLADHPRGFRTGGTNSVTMYLNAGPVWALRLELGAAKLSADLAPFTAENIEIKTGAADVRVRLGDRAERCRVNIQAGVSSISVQVPESAGCEISSESGLSLKTFNGFVERGDGNYRTANFDTASRKIFLYFKAGVSSLKVVRY
ncbi:MAG TPA: hypothetical protein VF514_02405 [Bacteroidota bacterium]